MKNLRIVMISIPLLCFEANIDAMFNFGRQEHPKFTKEDTIRKLHNFYSETEITQGTWVTAMPSFEMRKVIKGGEFLSDFYEHEARALQHAENKANDLEEQLLSIQKDTKYWQRVCGFGSKLWISNDRLSGPGYQRNAHQMIRTMTDLYEQSLPSNSSNSSMIHSFSMTDPNNNNAANYKHLAFRSNSEKIIGIQELIPQDQAKNMKWKTLGIGTITTATLAIAASLYYITRSTK